MDSTFFFFDFIYFQILDPLRAMVTGAPLEDARHLAQRYSRMRQEAETQVNQIAGYPVHQNYAIILIIAFEPFFYVPTCNIGLAFS